MKAAFSSGISGETNQREVAFEQIVAAENSLKKVHRQDDILKMIHDIKQYNKELYDMPSTSSNSELDVAVDFFDSADKSHPNYCLLDEMTEEQQLSNFELDLKLVDAEAHLIRGLLQFMDGSYLRGFYNFRNSYLKFKEVYHKIETLKDEPKTSSKFVHSDVIFPSYFGMGVFNFLISVLPPTLASILSVLGFDADRELGLKLMTQAQEYGGRGLGNASFMLCINYLFVPRALQDRQVNLNLVKPILDKIYKQYPKGGFFKWVLSHYELKIGDLTNSVIHIKEAVSLLKEAMGTSPNNYLFETGFTLVVAMQFEEAQEVLYELINKEHANDSKGNAALILAVCKLKCGDIKGANEIIDNLSKYVPKQGKFSNEKIETLKYAKNEEERHLIMYLSFFQLMYLRRDLANLKPEHAKPLYELFQKTCLSKTIDEKSKVYPDIQACLSVIRAQFTKILDDAEKSLPEFQNAIAFENKIKIEKQWIAFSYYELAESLYLTKYKKCDDSVSKDDKLKLLHDAKHNLEKCNKISGYSFEEVLHTRAKLALKQVEDDIKHLKH